VFGNKAEVFDHKAAVFQDKAAVFGAMLKGQSFTVWGQG